MNKDDTNQEIINNNTREDRYEKLQRLRTSAKRLQEEVDNITREIEQLQASLSEEKQQQEINTKEGRRQTDTTEPKLQVGQRIQYNRRGGKRLNKSNGNNPHGTISRITDKWVYFDADNGEKLYRAHKNVASI